MNHEATCILTRLSAIADAYDANELDSPARKFWGASGEWVNATSPSLIELYDNRGGRCLLTLQDCLDARAVLRDLTKVA